MHCHIIRESTHESRNEKSELRSILGYSQANFKRTANSKTELASELYYTDMMFNNLNYSNDDYVMKDEGN